MYRSRDLSTWEYEGVILRAGSSNDTFLRPPLRFERPKLLFNKMTGRYVLWCHFVKSPGDHGFTDGAAEALFCLAASLIVLADRARLYGGAEDYFLSVGAGAAEGGSVKILTPYASSA